MLSKSIPSWRENALFLVIAGTLLACIALCSNSLGQETGGESGGDGELTLGIYTDSNNDGTVEGSAWDVFKCKNDPPGRVLCLDKEGDGSGQDELAQIQLVVPDALDGTVKLEATAGGSLIKIWDKPDKTGTEIHLPATWSPSTAPCNLYVDGIATGCVSLKLSYYGGRRPSNPCCDEIALYVIDTISYSPGGNSVYTWEPAAWPLFGGFYPSTDDPSLQQLAKAGFEINTYRFQDPTANDDDTGTCTLANFKSLKNASVLLWSTHGNNNGITAAYFLTEPAAFAWQNGEIGMFRQRDLWGYSVLAQNSWMQTNWAPSLSANRAIVLGDSCYSAQGVVQAAGGRVGIGALGAGASIAPVFSTVLGRMCGTDRVIGYQAVPIGKAWSWPGTGSFVGVQLSGNGTDNTHLWTTLFPAVTATFPDQPLCPKKDGAGCALFNTYMLSTDGTTTYISPDNVVVPWAHDVSAVSACRWFGNGSGNYGVSFDFHRLAPTDFVTMRLWTRWSLDAGVPPDPAVGNRAMQNNAPGAPNYVQWDF
jgi:hypothetical protein